MCKYVQTCRIFGVNDDNDYAPVCSVQFTVYNTFNLNDEWNTNQCYKGQSINRLVFRCRATVTRSV